MSTEPKELAELRRRAGEIADPSGVGGLLLWDENTMMPPGGAEARADQFEALERIIHYRLTDPSLGRLLDKLEPYANDSDPESDDGALIRNLRRYYHKAAYAFLPTSRRRSRARTRTPSRPGWPPATRPTTPSSSWRWSRRSPAHPPLHSPASMPGGEFAHPV